MLIGMCANSPAMLCRPRSTSPLTTMPTPTPSDTLTNTRLRTGDGHLARFPDLRQRAGAAGVLDVHRRPVAAARRPRRSTLRQPSVGACSTRPVPESTMPGTTTPMPSHLPASAASASSSWRMRAASAATKRRGSRAVGMRDDVRSRPAHRIGQHQERAAGADVDGDARSLAGVDVEQRRLASARGLAGGPFDDVALVEQLLDEEADGAAAHLHAAGQVGARDRLMAADQRERDLPVDLARGAAGRDVEAVGVNASHRRQDDIVQTGTKDRSGGDYTTSSGIVPLTRRHGEPSTIGLSNHVHQRLHRRPTAPRPSSPTCGR